MMITPPPLRQGDTVALVAPASKVKKSEVDTCIENFEAKGFQVKASDHLCDKWGNFAGTDEHRAASIMEAFKDESVKAIWCMRGGYGSTRLLGKLDYEIIRSHPKALIGMSDITALHLALNQKARLVSYLGPNFRALSDQSTEHPALATLQRGKEPLVFKGEEALVSGKGVGLLTGGNLSTIASTMGTPWQIETNKKIFLLEDINEKSYRIDRYLNQLKQAKLLDGLAGLILASFINCDSQQEGDFTLDDIFEDYFGKAPYPVLKGFPSGHIEAQVTLPLGRQAELDTYTKLLTFRV